MYKSGNRWLVAIGLVVLMALGFSMGSAAAQVTPNEVEIVGAIQSVDVGAIMVNDIAIDITAAEVKVDLEVGLEVRVEGFYVGSIVRAREVQAAEDMRPDELELVGTLESLDATTAVVSGTSFDISTAEVETGLAVGDQVKVHATLSEDGVWVARELEAFTPEDTPGDDGSGGDDSQDDNGNDDAPEGEFEIVGTLQEVGDDYIIVAGQRIDISQAEIKDALVVGTLVKVHVSEVDGTLVAREVENADQDDQNDDGIDDDDGDDDSDDDDGDDSDDDSDDDSQDGNSGQGSDDNGSDDSGDDNGGDNGGQGSDDNGSDDSGDDNGGDNGGQGSDDSGSDDNGGDNGGSDDSQDDSGDDNGGDNGGSDDSQDDNGSDDSQDDNGGDNGGQGSDDGGGDDNGGHGGDDNGSDDKGNDNGGHGGDDKGSDDKGSDN